MRPLDIRDDIGFALEGGRLRLAETADWIAERYDSRGLPRGLPIAAAAIAVAAGLYTIQDSGESPGSPTSLAPAEPSAPLPGAAPVPAVSSQSDATLYEGPGFSLALPNGWVESEPAAGAAFAAVSADGLADATLVITEAPKLSFARFEQQSLERLALLGGNARVVDRTVGPTPETTIVELAAGGAAGGDPAGRAALADPPSADAPYRVTLRAAGPFRYFLATSLAADAPPTLVGDTELLRGTFRPDAPVEANESR